MQQLLEVTIYKEHKNFVSGRGNDLQLVCQFCYNDKTNQVVFMNIANRVQHNITNIIDILTFIQSKGYNVNYIRNLDIHIQTWGEAMKDLVDNFKLSEYAKVYSLAQKLK